RDVFHRAQRCCPSQNRVLQSRRHRKCHHQKMSPRPFQDRRVASLHPDDDHKPPKARKITSRAVFATSQNPPTKGREMNIVSTITFMISTRKAPVIGTTMNASGAGPCRREMACMLAMAVAVDPKQNPRNAPDMTAAS